MAHERDYIVLGLCCGEICENLERRLDKEGLDDIARDVMNQLTA